MFSSGLQVRCILIMDRNGVIFIVSHRIIGFSIFECSIRLIVILQVILLIVDFR